jgi:hypothetical protein
MDQSLGNAGTADVFQSALFGAQQQGALSGIAASAAGAGTH